MHRTDLLPIGELAARTGVAVSAIRFYEAKGLIASLRTAGGQRRFLRAETRRLSFILIAQQMGLSLDEIAAASLRNVPPMPPTGAGSAPACARGSTRRSRRSNGRAICSTAASVAVA